MPAETVARWTLAGYCLLFAGLVLWRALRCPQGWRLWLLYALDVAYCRICQHWRANRPCPFLNAPSAIVIANHRCVIDPGLIWVGVTNLRPLEFLTAAEYFGRPLLNFIFDNMRSIPVARDGRDMAAIRTALRRLKEGRLLGVFPEGGINTSPGTELLPGSSGIAWLALQSKSPVYPVFIHNAPRVESMIASLFEFKRIRIIYGDPIDLSAYYGKRAEPALLQEVTDLLMRRLAALGGLNPRSPYAAGKGDTSAAGVEGGSSNDESAPDASVPDFVRIPEVDCR
jgi:1-acyl-sn-glycerol-3-phosphate acyltransferase